MDSLRELLVEIQYRDMATPELNKVDNKVDSVKDGFSKMGANVKTTEMATSKFGDTAKKTTKGLSSLGTKSKTATTEIKGLESRIKESSNTTSRSIDRLNKQHKLWELSANKVAIALRKNSKKSQVLKEKTKILSSEIKKLNPVLEETKRKYGDNSKEAQNLEDHILDLRVQHAEFNKELKNFKVNNITSKLNAIGDKMGKAGKTLTTRVTLPMVGVGAAAIKTTATFDDTMSKVRGITGASQEEFDQLREKAMQMGRDTKFSASEAGEAFTYMGMAGWDAKQSLAGIEGVMGLAAASGEDLASVSDIVTDALSAFGMQAKDSTKFADLLASASSNSNTNVGMLGESFSYVAPLFGSLGYTAEDSALALGLMANAGVKGSKAGTALRGAITNLVKPTDSMATAMKKLGLKITDADGNMKPFKTAMDDMRSKFRGLSKEQQAQYASTIFGKEAMSGMLAIINASEADYAKLTNATREYTGEAQRMADVNEDNIGGAFRSLKSAVEGAAITVGDILKPTIRDIAETVRDWTKKFTELNPATQETIVKIGAMAAAAGPLLIVGGKITSGLSSTIGLVSNFTGLLGKFKGAGAIATGSTKLMAGGIGKVGLTAKLGTALMSPWTLGIAGAGVAAYGLYKYLKKDTIPEVKIFDSTISKSTKKAVGGFLKLEEDATKSLKQLSWSGTKVTEEMSKKITGNFDKMKTQIVTKLEEQKTEALSSLGELFSESATMSEKEKQDMLTLTEEKYNKQIQKTEEGNRRIAEILEGAKKQNRQITEEEKREINRIKEDMKEDAVRILSESEAEQLAIMERLKVESSKMSANQAAEVVKNSIEQKEKTIASAEKEYQERLKYAAELRADGTNESIVLADKVAEEAKRQRDEAVKNAKKMHEDVVKEARKQAKEHVNEIDWESGEIMSRWSKLMNWFANNPVIKWFKTKSEESKKQHDAYYGVAKPRDFEQNYGREWNTRVGRNAMGTNYWKGGLTELAERGPELVLGRQVKNLPKGTKVIPNHQTENILKNITGNIEYKANIQEPKTKDKLANINYRNSIEEVKGYKPKENYDKPNKAEEKPNKAVGDTFAPTIIINPQTSNPKEIASIKKEVEKQLEPMLERYFYKLKKKRLSTR